MLGLAALLTALSACSSAGGPGSIVEIAPASPAIEPGGTVQFIARVAGVDETANWSVLEPGGGTIDASGMYTAPQNEGTYTVLAAFTSPSTSESTAVHVKRNIQVDVIPSSATMALGESLALTASVTANVKTVAWSVAETGGGTVTAAGVYTAPQTAGTYTVVATSTADPTKSGASAITVTAPPPPPPPPPTVAISITPQTASIATGNSFQFAASITGSTNVGVTWSVAESGGGTVNASGLYITPATAGTYHVVATSQADTSKTASAAVTVTAPAPPPPSGVVTAFPGAQGGGALSKGGRGGTVYEVTNLNDSGTGSLRACVNASGPRTCVFRVSGNIKLTSDSLYVTNPYLTVAGQTAPGGGIVLDGRSLANTLVRVYTHDVTWRYMRMRHGYYSATPSQSGDIVAIRENAKNVIFDHNSVSWPQDENLDVWTDTSVATAPTNITFSWNIVAEPFSAHPTSIITGSNSSSIAAATVDLDFHHNLVANSSHRNPLIKTGRTRIVNNLWYNWYYYSSQFIGYTVGDVIGNLYKRGPITPTSGARVHEVEAAPSSGSSYYVAGNKGSYMTESGDNWSQGVYQVTGENGSEIGLLSTSWKRTTPLSTPVGGIAIVPDPVSTIESKVLPVVGASQRLDCNGRWVSNRDAVDVRILNDYQSGTGFIPNTEADVGGFPTIASGSACADSDHDGMPDAWEIAHGLNPNDPSDRNAVASDGFTQLEHYLAGQ